MRVDTSNNVEGMRSVILEGGLYRGKKRAKHESGGPRVIDHSCQDPGFLLYAYQYCKYCDDRWAREYHLPKLERGHPPLRQVR